MFNYIFIQLLNQSIWIHNSVYPCATLKYTYLIYLFRLLYKGQNFQKVETLNSSGTYTSQMTILNHEMHHEIEC